MRKITFFKTVLLAIVMMVGSGNAWGQLLVEDFSYTAGTVLTTAVTADATTGWAAQSASNGTANIDVTTGLNFSGYLSGGVGGAANADANGQDIFKPFTSQTSGVLYTAFLLKITANTTAGYFFHLGPNPIGTTFFSRVWVNATANGIGLTNTNTAPPSYISVTTGSTVLVVLKHIYATNMSYIYVLNSFSATEPLTPDASVAETLTSIGSLAIRQYNATQSIVVDGIRVGTTWSEAVTPAVSSCTASTLSFATPSYNKTVGDATFTQAASSLNATTAIAYSTSNSAAADVNPTTGAITIGVAGSATITATQAAGTHSAVDYCAATTSYSITVADAPCTASNLAFATASYNKFVGDAAFTQSATSLNGTTAITYESDNTAVATVNATTGEVAIVGTGTANIKATQALGIHNTVNYCASTATYAVIVTTTAPTITVTEVTVPNFIANIGSESNKTINVSGINLTSEITLVLSGTNSDQFSVSQASVAQSGGNAANTSITVKYLPTTTGTHTATLTLSSTGATPIIRTLSGTASLNTPVATSASGLSLTGLTANWDAVAGATEYQLDVYTKIGGGTTTVLSENFNGFTAGTSTVPDGTDVSASLDTYTQTTGWTGAKVYEAGGTIKMGTASILGSIVTPTINLSANSGAFKVSFKSMAWSTDATDLKIYLNDVLVSTVPGLNNDATYTLSPFSVDLTGGTATSKIKFEGSVAAKGRFFLENLTITQGGTTTTPLIGSPFAVTGANSKALEGLNSSTTYYYTVIAKNGTFTTPVSNEIAASTTTTEVVTGMTVSFPISVINGKIQLTATAGETVAVYNTIGQKILSKITVEGLNSIAVSAHGMVIVKIGNKVAKVIL